MRERKPKVYIFRGAPASGKGTLVPEFAKTLPKPVALIEQDKLRWGIHLIGREVTDITSEEHRMAYENTLALYERYLKVGRYTIVVEGLFTWDNEQSDQGAAKTFLELARANGFEATSIVLAAEKAVLARRNVERQSYTTPPEEFDALYESIYSTIDSSELVIDSTNETSEQTLARLMQFIS